MIQGQNNQFIPVFTPFASTAGSPTYTATAFDTAGWDQLVLLTGMELTSSDHFFGSIILQESATSSASFTAVTAFTGMATSGAALDITAGTSGAAAYVCKYDVDLKKRARWLRVVLDTTGTTAGANDVIFCHGIVTRQDETPATAAQMAVSDLVIG